MRLHKCYGCFVQSDNPYCFGKENEKIPRKKKKELKRYFSLIKNWYDYGMMEGLSSCTIALDYRFYKKYLSKFFYLKKYKSAIDFIINSSTYESTGHGEIRMNNDMKLGYYWENDSDYDSSSAVESFHFKDPCDNTWFYGQLKEYLKRINIDIINIKNEKELLKIISNKLKNNQLRFVKDEDDYYSMVEELYPELEEIE